MRHPAYRKYFFIYFWATLVVSMLSFLPTLAQAQGVVLDDTSNGAFFTPAPADQSILYLGELFGSVPPILAGTGSSLLADLFKIFNTAVLSLGIIFAGYTTFVGILNTAGEGEMLGKGWSSIWVPIRTVAGIALLIPTASGYCVCQIFMMWLLVQGVGAADTLTTKILDYMRSGQLIFVKGDTGNASGESADATQYDNTVKTLYQGLSCMQAYQKDYPAENSGYTSPPQPVKSTYTATKNDPLYPEGTAVYAALYDFIAYKSAENVNGTTQTQAVSCGQINISSDNSQARDYLSQGVNAIMPSLNASAYFMVSDNPAAVSGESPETTVMKDTYNFVGADFINEVENTYLSYVKQADNSYNVSTHGNGAFYDDIQSYGWSTLGELYWDMANSVNAKDGTNSSSADNSSKLAWSTATHNITTQASESYDPSEYYSQNALKYGNSWATQFIDDLIASRSSPGNGSDGSGFKEAHSKDYIGVATDTLGALTMGTLNAMLIKFKDGRNPMIVSQEMGHDIVLGTEIALTTLAALLTGLAIGAGVTSSMSPTFLVFQTAVFGFVLPGVMLFSGMLLVLGGTLSVIIPFIPALAYFMAVIAWLVATVETIVAAPIVAIGVIHPEGHAVWGKAEPAIMLMTNMFLRPSLIVIGMAAGIILSFISIQFINFGYEIVMQKILDNKEPTSVEAVLYLTTYVGLVLACVNKSFSTIDAVPEQVMRWIQGGEATKFGGGQEAMQKLQSGQEGHGSKAGEGTARGSEQASGAGEKAAGSGDKQHEREEASESRKQKAKEKADAAKGSKEKPSS